MSSTNKTANYELSQFVGTDIPSILNDYNGDMRKIDTAIKAVANAEGSSASDIAGLQATVGQHTTEISGLSSTVNSLSGRVIGIESKIPANASESNKLITAQDIPEIPSVEQLEQDVANLQTNVNDLQEEVSDIGGDVKAIQLCVPSTASESNKLATMADVSEGTRFIHQVIESYSLSNYADLETMLKAIGSKIDEELNDAGEAFYESNRYVLKYGDDLCYLNKASAITESGVTKGVYIFTGVHYRQQGNKNITICIDPTAYEIKEESFSFANQFTWEESPTNGAVTGYTFTYTADCTSMPNNIDLCKMY